MSLGVLGVAGPKWQCFQVGIADDGTIWLSLFEQRDGILGGYSD